MDEHQTQQPIPQPIPEQPQSSNLDLILLVGALGILIILGLIFGNSKYRGDKLSEGARWANDREIHKNNRKALKQIKQRKHNKAALQLDRLQGLYLTGLEQSTIIYGGAGYGKTQSGIHPMLHSVLDQGWGAIVYDVKEDLVQAHAMEAIAKGYKVFFFAPGKDYTDQINPLDFIRDELDTGAALELANVLHLNLKPKGTSDPFFDSNGDAALQSAFLLAKAMPFKNFMQAFAVLKLPDFVKRLYHASVNNTVSPWVSATAAALIAGIDSPETIGSIISTSITYFSRLIAPDLLPSILQTTIPLDIDEKTIVFVVPDKARMSATAPLCAAVIHMLIERNFLPGNKRKTPCFVSLDEFPTIRLPKIDEFAAVNRSFGQSLCIAVQSAAQLEEIYGIAKAKIIQDNMGTTLSFNPGKSNLPIAKKISDTCGQQRIKTEQHSKSRGRNSQKSVSVSYHKEPLITPDEVISFGPGEVVIQSPGLKHPYHVQLSEDTWYEEIQKDYQQQWHQRLRPALVQRNKGKLFDNDALTRKTKMCRFEAEITLPHPDEEDKKPKEQANPQLPQLIGA